MIAITIVNTLILSLSETIRRLAIKHKCPSLTYYGCFIQLEGKECIVNIDFFEGVDVSIYEGHVTA